MKNLTRILFSLGTGLCLILGQAQTAHAILCSPLIVTTTTDSNDGSCSPGTCSLRDAITDANAGCPGDITFANGVTGTITLGSSLPDITTSMNILGPGSANLTVSGNDSVAPLNITTGVGTTVNISNLSISHAFASNGLGAGIRISSAGDVIVDNCELDHNANVAFGSGGAIGIQGGNVTLSNDVITTNSASSGTAGGINVLGGGLKIDHSQIQGNLARVGGGLSIGENAFVLILNSSISDNHADANSEGGGIENFRGEIIIDSSNIGGINPADGNTAGDAAGIFNDGGTITISNSTIGNNISQIPIIGGGGILNTRLSGNNNGVLVVENSTFVDNQAGNEGGAIGNYSGGDATISNCTFTGNSAVNGGGALYNEQTMQVNDVTLSENTATSGGGNIDNDGVLKISNSIVSNSSGTNCANTGILDSLGNNLDNGNSCGFTKSGDLSNTDPLLDPSGLQANGGPTLTIALQGKSPALDAASSTSSETEDQRGISRPQGSAPDIGAFELEVTPAPTPNPNKGGGGGCALGGGFAAPISYGWCLLLLVMGAIWMRRARGRD
jgi:CSLREA domain-containing protein